MKAGMGREGNSLTNYMFFHCHYPHNSLCFWGTMRRLRFHINSAVLHFVIRHVD